MSKFLACAALAVLMSVSSAHAQQAYAGAAVAGGGTMQYRIAPDAPKVDEHVLFGRLYGGYAFSDSFALEGGWAGFENTDFAKADTGAPFDAKLKVNLLYVAARASYRFNDAWSVAGKLGAARLSQAFDTGGVTRRAHGVRPMFGVGVTYDLTRNAALTLELNDYGTLRTSQSQLKVRKLEAGVKFSF